MKIKVSEATRIQLDWLVATIEGLDVYIPSFAETPWLAIRTDTGIYRCPSFTTDWAQGGALLERELIATRPWIAEGDWSATVRGGFYEQRGPTMLVAGLRCYVASKLGDEVEIPEELA